jgi:hypothetical protein
MDPVHADSAQNYEFSLFKKKTVLTLRIPDTLSLKVQFLRKSYIGFWVDIR